MSPTCKIHDLKDQGLTLHARRCPSVPFKSAPPHAVRCSGSRSGNCTGALNAATRLFLLTSHPPKARLILLFPSDPLSPTNGQGCLAVQSFPRLPLPCVLNFCRVSATKTSFCLIASDHSNRSPYNFVCAFVRHRKLWP